MGSRGVLFRGIFFFVRVHFLNVFPVAYRNLSPSPRQHIGCLISILEIDYTFIFILLAFKYFNDSIAFFSTHHISILENPLLIAHALTLACRFEIHVVSQLSMRRGEGSWEVDLEDCSRSVGKCRNRFSIDL